MIHSAVSRTLMYLNGTYGIIAAHSLHKGLIEITTFIKVLDKKHLHVIRKSIFLGILHIFSEKKK